MDDVIKKFLAAFNGIEKYLAKRSRADSHMTFYGMVQRASETDPLVKRYAFDLKEYADLRNAIMHGYDDERPMAVPYPTTVKELETLRERLESPPKIGQAFRRKVFTCKTTDMIGDVARIMFEKEYSQVPAYDGDRFVNLLNTETISRWLAARIDENKGILEEESVGKVLSCAVPQKKHEFLGEDRTALEALQCFERAYESGYSLDAVVMTKGGKKSEQPTGILTTFEIPKLQSLVSLSRN